jgi:hypothetical protein
MDSLLSFFVIPVLLTYIATQTVILDACHAGSSTRQAAGPQVRGFDLPPDYVLDVPDFEAEESASRAMGPSTTSGWSADLTSHVLLAATSSSHPAREENGRGIFTRALLSFLREHTQPELLTYSDVILGLPPLGPAGVCVPFSCLVLPTHGHRRQQPQCEGKNAGRHLFRTSKPGHGYRFRLQDDVVIVEAGELHGVNKDAVFDLYARLHLDQAPLLRGLKSERLNAGHTMLRLPPATTLTTTEGWALQTSSSTAARASVVVDLSYDNWSPTTVSQSLCDFDADHAGRVRLALVCDDRQQLLITKDAGEKLTFDLTDEVCRGVGVERLRHSMRSDSDRLHETLAAASEFFHYLGYSNPQRPLHDFVQVEMHLLKYLDGAPAPVGENLLVDGRTFVPNHVYDMEDPGPHECYGLRVTNNYSEPLYAWIFAFNMNDLSIGVLSHHWSIPGTDLFASSDEVYRPVLAKENTDVCIEPHDVLTIGYGNGGVVPQAFFVPEGESTAVTHLKIFVSTTRLELGHISQGSPFCSGRGMKISRRGMPSIVWDTLVVTAIQQRTENGA